MIVLRKVVVTLSRNSLSCFRGSNIDSPNTRPCAPSLDRRQPGGGTSSREHASALWEGRMHGGEAGLVPLPLHRCTPRAR